MPPPDPRPLPGEPLALDLLDTEFVVEGAAVDLLASPATLAGWLHHAVGLDAAALDGQTDREDRGADHVVGPGSAVAEALVEARGAIRGVATAAAGHEAPPPGVRDALNTVLAHGRARRALGADGRPTQVVEADDPAWYPAVLAAYDLLDVLGDRAGRIRQCDHGRCVLWFLDTSRNGTRRWCTMARCGNRAKAERHYRRTRASTS